MRRAGSLLAAFLVLAAPARAADSVLGQIETLTLKNGLRLVLAPDSAARSVDLSVWYDAGSRYDLSGKTGVAHLFEHLMFRGSVKFPADQHARLVRAEGGSSGAYAAQDFSAFFETLPPDALELGLQLEADRMTGLQLTQAVLDTERSQVAGERSSRATPISVGLERLYTLAFSPHPYGVSIYGRESDLERVTLQDLRDFYRAHFGPAQATVMVVGRFDRGRAVAMAHRYFEPLKGKAPRPSRLPDFPAPKVEQRATETAEVPLRVVLAGWRVPARTDSAWPALSVLATLLTRGADAVLSKGLIQRDQPLCYSVQGDLDNRRDASLFYLAAVVAPDADSSEVERQMFAEVASVAREPVSAEDLAAAKRQTETGVWLGLQTPRGRAQALGLGQMLAGDPRDLDRLLAAIRSCTAEDLQRAARSLTSAGRNVVWLLPTQRSSSGEDEP